MFAAKRFDNCAGFVLGKIIADNDLLYGQRLGGDAAKLLLQKMGAVIGAHRYRETRFYHWLTVLLVGNLLVRNQDKFFSGVVIHITSRPFRDADHFNPHPKNIAKASLRGLVSLQAVAG